jgi:tetratricopeptide (TPR) repeat protein
MSKDDYTDALDAFNHATRITTTSAEIWNNKGTALAALGRYSDALDCFNTALTLSPAYTDAINNRQSVLGKGQVTQITGSPTPTIAPWILGGVTTPTTVTTPAGEQNATVVESLPPGTIAVTATETPVPTKTTYTPLSPFCVLVALVVAGIVLSGAKR